MAESGGLENRCVREGTVGSNPTPSANRSVSNPGKMGMNEDCECENPLPRREPGWGSDVA